MGPRSPTTLRMIEFQLERSIFQHLHPQHGQKVNVVEFFILGPSMARLALSRMARQRIVGPAITMTTPESRSDQPQKRAKRPQLLSGSPESGIHLWSCALLRFFFLAVSRPDSGNCHERDGWCTENNSPHAHTRTFSRCVRHMWLHVWLKA